MNHEPPTILITGSPCGICHQVVRLLAEWECDFVVTGRDRGALAKTADLLSHETGQSVSCLPLDATNPESLTEAAAVFGQSHTHLDVLITQAGIDDQTDRSILDVEPETIQAILLTSILGPLLTARAFLPWLRRASPGGRVIHLAPDAGELRPHMAPSSPISAISKTALGAVTRQLAQTLRPERIAVNSVCPSRARTDQAEQPENSNLHGAETVVWLATEAPLSVTGRILA